jgi:cation transport ATPase
MVKQKTSPQVRPRLSAYHVLPDSPLMQQNFLVALASLEARADHPLAADVMRVAKINSIAPRSVEGFQQFEHRGIGGLVQLPHEQRPRAIVIGSREFVEECGLQMPDILEVTYRKWAAEKNAVVAIGGWDGWVRGVIKWENIPQTKSRQDN